MPVEAKGKNEPHGHGHRQQKVKDTGNRSSRTTKKVKPATEPEPQEERSQDVEVLHSQEDELVYMTYDNDDEQKEENGNEQDGQTKEGQEEEGREMDEQDETEETKEDETVWKRDYTKCNLNPDNFNVREFNTNMSEFLRTLDDPRYSQVDDDYPVQELVNVVGMVTKSVNDYRTHTADTQYQLEALTEAMTRIRENLHFSVSRQAMNLRADDESQTQEEKDLRARLTQLTNSLAKANADVTEAIRLATETEATAVKANIAAERAREETKRVEEEGRRKEEVEKRRRIEQSRQMEEAKRQKEEEERKAEEEKRRKEEEWKKRESYSNEKAANVYDTWPLQEFEHTNENGETEITCLARGEPGHFDKRDVICELAKEKENLVTYLPNEELISHVIDLRSKDGEDKLKRPVFVAIPHVLTRTGALTREAVVKAMLDGEWKDLPTRDVTIDTHKDNRFAQAEVTHLTTLLVMSRLKRDYYTLHPSKPYKITSSVDQRLTLTIPKGTLDQREHFLLQVQPVDSATTQEFNTREGHGKSLLNSSSIIHTAWETHHFYAPIEVTVSCAPNPAKAKKMALARKLKEDKMKNPNKPPVDMTDQDKEKEREKKRIQQSYQEQSGEVKKMTKWYMGEYGNTEDDENDRLHFLYAQGGKWHVEPDMEIRQVKVDVLGFTLEQPIDKFVILRTRTNVDEHAALALMVSLNEYLGKRFVEAVVRQRADDPFDVALQVTPVSRREAVVKQLADQGFESGPSPSHVICLHEGDIIELGFSGNIECKHELPSYLVYKSNVPTVTFFTVKEENKFRQKDHQVYSGLICLSRRYIEVKKGRRGQQEEEGGHEEVKRERLCALQINIPKYHIEPNSEPVKAPVTIRHTRGTLDTDLLHMVADELKDEWKKLAHYLGVHRARVQAIIRNINISERPEKEAKYEMLLTWLKGAPKSMDKVAALSAALKHCERYDLAEAVTERGRSSPIEGRSQSPLTAEN